MALTNLQLVLLDNLIYLGKICEYKEVEKVSVRMVIQELLNGDLDCYWKDELKEDQSDENPGQCLMSRNEWLEVLNAIAADDILMNLTISNVEDADGDSDRENTNFRAACFTYTNPVDSGLEMYKRVATENQNKAA